MSRTGPVGVGIIGAGVISGAYLENLVRTPDVEVLIVGDLYPDVAKAKADEYGVAASGTADDVLAHPDVEIVVNLTIPAAHVEVGLAVIAAGKHVYSEKPLALDRESGRRLLDAAEAAGLRVGCAPDTVLGAGIQTARRVIERGDIGTPLSGMTIFQTPGPESWHPAPAFLFARGAGPLFDMGPYYLSTLNQLLGPMARVAAVGSQAHAERTIGSGPRAGEVFPVEVPTQVSMLTQFDSGATAQSIFSFDSPAVRAGFVEITGTEATLSVPDPNTFTGELQLRRATDDDWQPVTLDGSDMGRGMGVVDMARALRADVGHRIDGATANHVLDVMIAATDSIDAGAFVDISSRPAPSPALPADWDPFAATL